MAIDHATRLRRGALALGASAALLGIFPLVRPFFRLDVFSPGLLVTAAPPLASAAWVASHALGLLGFALLPLGLLALAGALAATPEEDRARAAALTGIVGAGLVLPAFGVETFAMPVVGRLYLEGARDLGPLPALIYRGPMTLTMIAGLVLLAVAAIRLARAIGRTARLPRWAGVVFAAGLSLWLPLLPRPVRVLDGLAIGLGGLWLARGLWKAGGRPMPSP